MNCLRSSNPFQHNVIRDSFRPSPLAKRTRPGGEGGGALACQHSD